MLANQQIRSACGTDSDRRRDENRRPETTLDAQKEKDFESDFLTGLDPE